MTTFILPETVLKDLEDVNAEKNLRRLIVTSAVLVTMIIQIVNPVNASWTVLTTCSVPRSTGSATVYQISEENTVKNVHQGFSTFQNVKVRM